MSRAISSSTSKDYGLTRVCRVWELARSTAYWQLKETPKTKKRPGPQGPCSDDDLLTRIKAVLASLPFHSEGYRKVWARLRFSGVRTSKRRALRLLRENNLLAPHRQGHAHGPKAHDGTIITERCNTMWGTDMTGAITLSEGQAAIFIAVEHCSAECVGIHVAKCGNRFEALEPIRQGVREYFGGFGKGAAKGLSLRHDHGSQYMSNAFQDEIAFLGIESSPAFVREPEGNGCAERFIRTLKENLLWIRTFNTVEELRQALLEFKRWYNENWIIQRHGYKTPQQVREKQLVSLACAA